LDRTTPNGAPAPHDKENELHHPRLRTVAVALAALPIPLTLAAAVAPHAAAKGQQPGGSLTVEVAETGSRFVPDEHFVDSNGVPTRGNYFITEGYLYEPGTLTCTDGVCDGVVYDDAGTPSPEFPDRVLGSWTCYGTHTSDAATTASGAIVVTTQVFDLGTAPGEHTIVTSGFELIDVDVPIERAIVGGTGQYAGAEGVETQSLLGLNNPELVIDGVPYFGVSLAVRLAVEGD
jgi:Dirigent-like protein